MTDKNESGCSAAQYDGYIKEVKDDIFSMIRIEKELTGHEVVRGRLE